MLRPIPEVHGVGYCDNIQHHELVALGFREEKVGSIWNYHVTFKANAWPEPVVPRKFTMDAFSPNLNKSLHVGHLRQLALACSYQKTFPSSEFVALLGATLGVQSSAEKELQEWFDFLHYQPKIYYDVLMPRDYVDHYQKDMTTKSLICKDLQGNPIESTSKCGVWDGPNGPVVVLRSDGSPTYSFYDIAFAKKVGPDYYVTGIEQKEHFENLGLGDKHLPMGLVLGLDGKKMKSRSGENVKAADILKQVMDKVDGENDDQKKKLAWNVLVWNFLHISRTKNVSFDLEEWTKTESPGLYVTYTYARVEKALENATINQEYTLNDEDLKLIGYAGYLKYYLQRSMNEMDPAPLANYTHKLARKLGVAYHTERINNGRPGFIYVVNETHKALAQCMTHLGMFLLKRV